MADAKRNPATEESITLTLSVEEASFLAAVLDRVGGCPTNSPRRYAPSIIDALSSAGVVGMESWTLPEGQRIYFGDGKTPTPETLTPETFEFRGQILKYGVLYHDRDGDETEFRPGGPTGTEFRWQDDGGKWSGWESLHSGYAPYEEIDAPTVDTVNVGGQELKVGVRYRDIHGCQIKFRNSTDGPEWNVGLNGWEPAPDDEVRNAAPYKES